MLKLTPFFLLALFLLPSPLRAQVASPAPGEVKVPLVQTAGPAEPSRMEAIRALVWQIQLLDGRIAAKNEEMAEAPGEEQRNALFAELMALERQSEDAKLGLLEVVAANLDLSSFESVEERPFTLQGAMEDLIRPLVEEVKNATADSREARALREQFEAEKRKGALIGKALQELDGAIAEASDPDVRSTLQSVRDRFAERYLESKNAISVLGYRLDQIDKERQSFVGQTRGLVASFFRERGRNLLFALLAAVVVFFGFRLLHRHLHAHTPLFRRNRTFGVRTLDVALEIFAFIGALLAAAGMLLLAGDWVLLGLVLLVLIAVALTAKDALPGYMDEMRLMLNIGPVREGERIVFNGVPWLVENLTFFTILRNPALRGGYLRMPVARLTEMLSRPVTDQEPWFPCDEGDWVLLDDEVYGRVVFQSVEMVRLVLLGGAQKTYPIEEFLEQNPRNHSHGFRIKTTLGIDYGHQAGCTTEILERLRVFFDKAVGEVVDRRHIRSLKIEFARAGASSLDYEVLLDVDGEMAVRCFPLQRALQRIGVDACNEFGLVIPFQQVTIHQGS